MDGLVERSLEERRVQGDDRPHPAERQASRQRDRVLLRDADIDRPLRESGMELRHSGPRGHSGRDPDDPAVGRGEGDELVGEDRGVVRFFRGASGAGGGGSASPFEPLPWGVDAANGRAGLGGSTSVAGTSIGGRAAPWNETWSASAGR